MTQIKNLAEDAILWVALALFCVAMLIDYVAGTKITEWLV